MSKHTRSTATNLRVAETKIESFAEDLGTMLGHARTKAEGWIAERQQIVKSLTNLRDEASTLLRQLGHDAAAAGRRGRQALDSAIAAGRSNGLTSSGAPKKRTMSARARKAISLAQKKRWAAQKAADKKR